MGCTALNSNDYSYSANKKPTNIGWRDFTNKYLQVSCAI